MIETKEVSNRLRQLPDANSLSKNDIAIAHKEMKILLPPKSTSRSSEKSKEFFLEENGQKLAANLSASVLSVDAAEFTPKSKNPSLSCLNSISTFHSDDFKFTFKPYYRSTHSITLPCIGFDNKLRQYLWKIDKAGDLLPLFNRVIPPPRTVVQKVFCGPSIVVPVCSNFQHASGGLIFNQFDSFLESPSGWQKIVFVVRIELTLIFRDSRKI